MMSVNRFLPLEFENKDVLEKFFSLRSQTQIMFKENVESCVLLGESTLKSSLLFQAAISFASQGDLVIFIRPRPFSMQPYQVSNLSEMESLTLECIKMVYISSPPELLQYLCNFHTKESFPIAIIVDDIQYYISHHSEDERKEFALTKLFAVLADTSRYISSKKGEPCHYMASLDKNLFSNNFFKRFFREVWFISQPDEHSNEYFITDDSIPAFRFNVHVNEDGIIIPSKMSKFSSVIEQSPTNSTTESATGSVT